MSANSTILCVCVYIYTLYMCVYYICFRYICKGIYFCNKIVLFFYLLIVYII